MVFVFVLALIVFAILGLLSERDGLSTEYYYKLTPRDGWDRLASPSPIQIGKEQHRAATWPTSVRATAI